MQYHFQILTKYMSFLLTRNNFSAYLKK